MVRIVGLMLGLLAGPPAPLRAPGDSLWLRLNIPSFSLEVYDGHRRLRRYRVAVGDREHPTPTGSFEITRVEWNPWWVPPASEWAAGDTMMAPGPRNPMGRVKLYFRDLYFIHGTPELGTLGRAASHGCVRLSNAASVQLALTVLRFGAPALDSASRRHLAEHPYDTTRVITLERPVRVELRYDLAEISGDSLVVYPDVYDRGAPDRAGAAREALRAAGHDSAAIRLDAISAALQRAGSRRVALPLRAVVRTVPQPAAPAPGRR